MNAKFKTSREDGRSNSRVILDYVKDGSPGRLYHYEELRSALNAGSKKEYDLKDVQAIVRRSLKQLSREQNRLLLTVPMEGYRLASARDHVPHARNRGKRAERQMGHAVRVLVYVREEELDEGGRQVRDGCLMSYQTVYTNQKAERRRVDRFVSAINNRCQKLDDDLRGIRPQLPNQGT